MVSNTEQTELREFVQDVFIGFSPAEKEFALDHIAESIASSVEHTTYEAEREALDQIFNADFDESIRMDTSREQNYQDFVDDVEDGRSASEAFEDHFGMSRDLQKAAFITCLAGAAFVIQGHGSMAAFMTAMSSAYTYADALKELKDQY